ncbi:ABC transporter permease [Chakrabartyella piscis]|uniref:ABC transporter permease n=1 Tax=Chakrabartyella piscis TaxID=2918914 RepID=UPI00295892FA|nr:ABC transporter permease [Chakrabartyella piscis]
MDMKNKKKFSLAHMNDTNSYVLKLVIAIIVMYTVMCLTIPYFADFNNFINILSAMSITGIISFGMTLVILTGDIDLSVGSLVAMTSAMICALVNQGVNPWLSVLIAFLACAGFGLINAFFIAKKKITAFIITMGTMNVARGIAYIIVGGKSQPFDAPSIRYFGKLKVFGVIPFAVVVVLVLLAVIWYVLKYTQFGRNVYAVGNNAETARLSGINVLKTQTIVFVIMGVLSAVAGFLLTAQAYSGIPQAGSGYELDAITAVVLGGTLMTGGSGTIIGTMLGAFIVAVVENGMNLMSVSYYYQLLVKGAIVIIAMVIAKARGKKLKK